MKRQILKKLSKIANWTKTGKRGLPVLHDTAVCLDGGRAHATDLECTVSIPLPETLPRLLIPRELLKTAARGRSDDDVSIEPTDGGVRIHTPEGTHAASVWPVDEYPRPLAPPAGDTIRVTDAADVARTLRRLRPFVDNDEIRETLRGVAVQRDTYVATDGKCLAHLRGPALPSNPPPTADMACTDVRSIIILPHRVWTLKSAAAWWAGAAGVTHNEARGCLTVSWDDGRRLDLRLVDGVYPAWPRILPSTDAPATTDLSALADLLPDRDPDATVTLSADGRARIARPTQTMDVELPTTIHLDAPSEQTFGAWYLRTLVDSDFPTLHWGRDGAATATTTNGTGEALVMPMERA